MYRMLKVEKKRDREKMEGFLCATETAAVMWSGGPWRPPSPWKTELQTGRTGSLSVITHA